MARLTDLECSLAFQYSDIASEWHPTKNDNLTPDQITPGSNKKVWWIDSYGHEWESRIADRVHGSKCPFCSGKKVLPGFNDLITTHPTLAAQWHPHKNESLTPSEVMAGTNKKVWWLCEEGHEWESSPNTRINMKTGCPVCSGKKVLIGYNDFATTHPELAEEWHPTKNGKLLPIHVSKGHHQKIWWQCALGHEWKASPNTRSTMNSNCPICASELQTSFPEQAIFYYLNTVTTAISRYALDARTEIDVYLPEYRIGIEYDGKMWHQDIQKDIEKNLRCGQKGVRLIRVRESGCPVISAECIVLDKEQGPSLADAIIKLSLLLGKSVDVNIDRDRQAIYSNYIKGKHPNSLANQFPQIAKEWHPTKNGNLTPEQVMCGTKKKVWWLGSCGHEWEAAVGHRTRGAGCPVCGGQVMCSGYNDLATTFPALVAEWHPIKNGELDPTHVAKSSHKKVWWICVLGHEWQASPNTRTNMKTGCPVCSSRRICSGYNDLLTTYPEISEEWHPSRNGALLPSQIMPGSNKKVWWLCSHGHEWQATPNSRALRGRGCPFCKKVDK